MLTPLTASIEFWMAFATICMLAGAYKLITKQNSEQIKGLGSKVDNIGGKVDDIKTDMKIDQARVHSNFEHMNEKINRIENDTTITRAQGTMLSEAIAKMEIKLQNIEREYYKSESN